LALLLLLLLLLVLQLLLLLLWLDRPACPEKLHQCCLQPSCLHHWPVLLQAAGVATAAEATAVGQLLGPKPILS
jgi:hypothetical protein